MEQDSSMSPQSRVELYAVIRRDARAGMSSRELHHGRADISAFIS